MSVFCDVYDFYRNFNGEKGIIGKSHFNLPIFYMAVKKSNYPKVIFQYSIHAREYITSYLAIRQLQDFAYKGKLGMAYFIPLVNPDGVDIAEKCDGLYKANGRGVDLNVNFDARWGSGEKNVNKKGDENYIGDSPFSESETKALRDFTLEISPQSSISYHSKGEEIYYEFHQDKKRKIRDYQLAKAVRKTTGYKIKSTPNSAGGYKDWCIERLKIPALTIEVGNDELSHPIQKNSLDEIYIKNQKVVDVVMQTLMEIL